MPPIRFSTIRDSPYAARSAPTRAFGCHIGCQTSGGSGGRERAITTRRKRDSPRERLEEQLRISLDARSVVPRYDAAT
jgi:hypothetical protein